MLSTHSTRPRPVTERLLEKIEMITESGCWIFMGSLDYAGYGHICLGRCTPMAHRVSYEHFREPVPAGLELDHLCRVRCCVNPWHLEAVTHLENIHRGKAGAKQIARTHCAKGHPYEGTNLIISIQTRNGRPRRRCRICENARCLLYFHKHKSPTKVIQ